MVATTEAMEKNDEPPIQPEAKMPDWLERLQLVVVRRLYAGVLPDALLPTTPVMEKLWKLHASLVGTTRAHAAPCWQQAYGWSYRFSDALPIPPLLEPLLAWVRHEIDARLNGVCLNWYDADLGHYMGPHRDNTKGLVKEAPIVTISLGASRVFRLKPWWPGDIRDVLTSHGTVLVMPFDTNRVWRHAVPHRACDAGRRISITFRAFEEPAVPIQPSRVVVRRSPRSEVGDEAPIVSDPERVHAAAHQGSVGW